MAAMPGRADGLVRFKDIAFRGARGPAFFALVAAIPAMFIASIALSSLATPAFSCSSAECPYQFSVGEWSGKTRLTVSYTFSLVPGTRGGWVPVVGANGTFFSFQIENSAGRVVGSGSGKLSMPFIFEDEDGSPDDEAAEHTESESWTFDLPKGDYVLNATAAPDVELSIVQESRLEQAFVTTAWLGILFSIILAGTVIHVMFRRDRENVERLKAAYPELFPGPTKPAMAYLPTGVYIPSQTPPGPLYLPAPPAGGQEPAQRSSLEFVPGGYVVEHLCQNCGLVMMSRPVDGILTCEHCGTPNRM